MVEVTMWGGGSYDPYTETYGSVEDACVEYARRMDDRYWPTWGDGTNGGYVLTVDADTGFTLSEVEGVVRRVETADEAAIR